MRIIIVDDENNTRKSIIRLINKLNPEYVVVGEADNGYDGMMLIKSLLPDVVIADIMMPRVNGFQMIENAHICSPDTRFVILSGHAEFELAKQAIRLSVVDYLLKPITADQLSNMLNRIQEDYETSIDKDDNTDESNNYSLIVSYIVNGLKENYAQRQYLEDYAKELKVTPEYAGSLFLRETGMNFSYFLRDIRMIKAKDLLEKTDDKIYEVAYKTGFSDAKYFSRVFKEYTGISPKSYIRNQLTKE